MSQPQTICSLDGVLALLSIVGCPPLLYFCVKVRPCSTLAGGLSASRRAFVSNTVEYSENNFGACETFTRWSHRCFGVVHNLHPSTVTSWRSKYYGKKKLFACMFSLTILIQGSHIKLKVNGWKHACKKLKSRSKFVGVRKGIQLPRSWAAAFFKGQRMHAILILVHCVKNGNERDRHRGTEGGKKESKFITERRVPYHRSLDSYSTWGWGKWETNRKRKQK